MKLKKILAGLMAAGTSLKKIVSVLAIFPIVLSLFLSCGTTAAAAEKINLKAYGYTDRDGWYIVDLYGMTQKQYDNLLNKETSFSVNVYSTDFSGGIFLETQDDNDYYKSSNVIAGYNGSKGIAASALGGGVFFSNGNKGNFFDKSNVFICEGLNGTASDSSYGFRWKFDANNADAKKLVAPFTSTKTVYVKINNEDLVEIPFSDQNSSSSDKVWKDETEWDYEVFSVSGLTFSIHKNTILDGYTSAVFTLSASDYDAYVSKIAKSSDATLAANLYINDKLHIFGYFYDKADRMAYGTIMDDKAVDQNSYDFVATIDDGSPSLILSYKNSSEMAVELQKNYLEITVNYMGYVGTTENLFCGDTNWYSIIAKNDHDIIKPFTNISTLSFGKISSKSYTGKAIKPTVTVKDGDKKLVNGTDYTVTYKNNTNIGTATVTITGKGNYTGTKTLTFKIVPKKVALTGKASGAKETLSWKKSAGATGYVVYRSVDGGKFTKLATTKSLKYTAKLTAGKKYQFKVRPYTTVNGSKVYGSWSNIVSAN